MSHVVVTALAEQNETNRQTRQDQVALVGREGVRNWEETDRIAVGLLHRSCQSVLPGFPKSGKVLLALRLGRHLILGNSSAANARTFPCIAVSLLSVFSARDACSRTSLQFNC